jgi:hypothetical protein
MPPRAGILPGCSVAIRGLCVKFNVTRNDRSWPAAAGLTTTTKRPFAILDRPYGLYSPQSAVEAPEVNYSTVTLLARFLG